VNERPNYAAVGSFYAMALGWVSLVALVLWALGASNLSLGAAQVAVYAVALLYMPAPMVAALIVERRLGRGYLMSSVFGGFRRSLPRLVVACAAVIFGAFALMLAEVLLLGNVAGVPGVGRLVTSSADLMRNLAELLGPQAAGQMGGQQAPEPLLLLAIAPFSGVVAGFTVNGVFAFGEEYGWRGWLMNELAPLGPVRANLLTGVLWGLWHAPLILMGFNYGPHRVLGIAFMCGLTTALSFLLWRAREYTGSLLAPAMLHGGFNAFQGFLVLTIVGRDPLVGVPAGVLGWVAIGTVAALLWAFSRGRLLAPCGELPEAVALSAAKAACSAESAAESDPESPAAPPATPDGDTIPAA
jgi:membrane protease YdiL (CAAX protease family)